VSQKASARRDSVAGDAPREAGAGAAAFGAPPVALLEALLEASSEAAPVAVRVVAESLAVLDPPPPAAPAPRPATASRERAWSSAKPGQT
jgi:hypothetical protein